MNPFRGYRTPENKPQAKSLRNAVEWGIIMAGFVVGTLLWIPATRPDWMKPTPDAPDARADEVAEAAPTPRKPRPSGRLRVIYVVSPPMHMDDVAKLERAKEYMELQYGLDTPVEIGVEPQPLEVCRARAPDGVINDEVVRCRAGYKVRVTLTRDPEATPPPKAEFTLPAGDAAADRRAASSLSLWGASVKREVLAKWVLPPESPPGLTAIVKVEVLPDGGLTSPQVLQSSGNKVFDESLIKAINEAQPSIPKLQGEEAAFAKREGGISLRFTKYLRSTQQGVAHDPVGAAQHLRHELGNISGVTGKDSGGWPFWD